MHKLTKAHGGRLHKVLKKFKSITENNSYRDISYYFPVGLNNFIQGFLPNLIKYSEKLSGEDELTQGMGMNMENEGLESSPISSEVNNGIQQFRATEEESTKVIISSLTDS